MVHVTQELVSINISLLSTLICRLVWIVKICWLRQAAVDTDYNSVLMEPGITCNIRTLCENI